ncbi:MAG TPA: oligosaccharide flippase family protein, partial [Dongiaceae bacterium]|nr:oligosaccharide flippase family protein [Dongiaceae bacterium]
TLMVLPFSGWLSEMIGLSQNWLLVGIPFSFCSFMIQLRLGQWQVRKEPKKFGAFQISQSLSNMGLSLLLVVVLLLGVDGRLMGYAGSVMMFGMLALILLYKDGLLRWSWRPVLMKEAASFGVPLIPHIIGAFLLLTVDRAVISSVLGLEAAGYYLVAAQLAMVLGLVLDSVNKAYVPWLYERLKRNNQDEKRFIVKLTYGYGAFLAACALIAFGIGEPALRLLAGEKYKAAGKLVGWLVLGQAFRGMYYMVSSYIFYEKRTGVIAKITITTGILHVVILYEFLNRFGLIGAAWAFCASLLVQWLVTWFWADRLVSMPWALRNGI